MENVAADILRSKMTTEDKVNHQPGNLVIYGSSSVLFPIRNKRQAFITSVLSCLILIVTLVLKRYHVDAITVVLLKHPAH